MRTMTSDHTIYDGPDTKARQREELKRKTEKFLQEGGNITQVDMGKINDNRVLTPSEINARSFAHAMEKKNVRSK
jgi:hypothetical protein|tara:strand:+ start:401 stop:625 length:225 start_codon:yes stop_codon:yes gene_type:complete